ncbi:MAG: hypothetical protein JNK87_16420 [Bryobacterales bacterium]|nr:hypothetical protein [Bryobacterales bacterium]
MTTLFNRLNLLLAAVAALSAPARAAPILDLSTPGASTFNVTTSGY